MSTVNLGNFEQLSEIARQNEWLLLDFWAQWCAPCKSMNPVLEAFSENNPDVAVVKINVDEQQEIAGQFGVRAIPTLVFLRRDEFLDQQVGAKSAGDLSAWINTLRAGKAVTP